MAFFTWFKQKRRLHALAPSFFVAPFARPVSQLTARAAHTATEAACIAVYRIPDPAAGIAVLNHFHGIGTISHAVVGGHGSDSAQTLWERRGCDSGGGVDQRCVFFWGPAEGGKTIGEEGCFRFFVEGAAKEYSAAK